MISFLAPGGTVDITIHEVTGNRSIKELHQASGGPWGGTKVDEEFRKLLISIIGSPVLTKFQKEYMEDFIDLFREFEVKKRDTKPESSGKQTFRVPVSLRELFETMTGEKIQDAINNMRIKDKVKWTKDKMQIDISLTKKFFDKAIEETVKHIEKLLQRRQMRDVSTILMVGGFSESPMLQQAVKCKFPKMRIINPPDAGSAVLKGAVIYGHNPRAILERKCKYTYGIDVCTDFDEERHDESKKRVDGDEEYCDNIFSRHVAIGQTVKVGEAQAVHSYGRSYPDQDEVHIIVFASTELRPMYTTDHSCVKLGQMSLDLPTTCDDKESIKVQMFYSGTEIEVEAWDESSGERIKEPFDFLG